MVNQFNSLRDYLDDKFCASDERQRKIETAVVALRVENAAKLENLAARVEDIEKQDLGGRMAKVEPVTQSAKWAIGVIVAIFITFLWGVLTHTILITYITGSHP